MNIDNSVEKDSFVISGIEGVLDDKVDAMLQCLFDFFSRQYPMDYEGAGLNNFLDLRDALRDSVGVWLRDGETQALPASQGDSGFKRLMGDSALYLLDSDLFSDVSVSYGPNSATEQYRNHIVSTCRDIYAATFDAFLNLELDAPRIPRPDDLDFRS